MDKEVKREAGRQYLHYFRIWFLVLGVMLVVLLVLFAVKRSAPVAVSARNNLQAPLERVYDYADVLSDWEEENLRVKIQTVEQEIQADLVIVTVNQDMEGDGRNWEVSMTGYADDFYDTNGFGYNRVCGDGALLLDNWMDGQMGSHLSTCGKVEDRMGYSEIERVLDRVYEQVEESPYKAYLAYIEAMEDLFGEREFSIAIPWLGILFLPLLIAGIYAITCLKQEWMVNTTNRMTYVADSKGMLKGKEDRYLRKNVTVTKIQSSSDTGSGGRSGGGGGHHISSGGVSHGGGSRRR